MRKVKAQKRRFNSPAYVAFRKATEREKAARQNLSEMESKQAREKAAGSPQTKGLKKQQAQQLQNARTELNDAEKELKKAKARLEQNEVEDGAR